ncbi:hypothetical protein ACMFMG_001341 [Clarireedia jacksonii]
MTAPAADIDKVLDTGKASDVGKISLSDPEAEDEFLVKYGGIDDMNDPTNWSPLYKWSIACSLTVCSNLAILMVAPAVPQILTEFHSNSQLYSTLLITIWTLGGIFAPLLVGPLAEIYGRAPVYNIANILFVIFCVGAAESTSIGMLITFRFLNGLSVASTTLDSSIVADMFVVEERGRAQSILTIMPLLGPVIGPIIGGFVAQEKGWRWSFWLATIVVGAGECGLLVLYRETYEPTILRRKAKRLRKATNNPAIHSLYDNDTSISRAFQKGMIRPLKVFSLPIFLAVSTCTSLIYAYIYLTLTTLTEVFEENYGFSEGTAGLSFLGIGIGMAVGALLCGTTLDWYTKKMKVKHDEIKPEWRLPVMAFGGIIVPAGLFVYGWTAEARVQYIAPIFGTSLLGFGLTTIVVPVTTYLTDVFGEYRASAIAAFLVYRNIVSILLPLAGPPMFKRLGLGWGNSILGFIALATIPLPFLLLRYGERLRLWSDISKRL